MVYPNFSVSQVPKHDRNIQQEEAATSEYTFCFLSHMGNLGKGNMVSKGELLGI